MLLCWLLVGTMAPELMIECTSCRLTIKTTQKRSVLDVNGSVIDPYWQLSYRHLLGVHTFLHVDHRLLVCLWGHSNGGLVLTVHEPVSGNLWGSPFGVEVSCGGEDAFACSLTNFVKDKVEVSAYLNVPPTGVQRIVFEVDLSSMKVREIQFPLGVNFSIQELTREHLNLVDPETLVEDGSVFLIEKQTPAVK
jgi:hypothetical protein